MCILKKPPPARTPAAPEQFQFKLGRRISSRPSLFRRGLRAEQDVYLSQPDFLRHTGIFGRNGSGKTLIARQIAQQQMASGGPVIYLDFKGDGSIRAEMRVHAARFGNAFRAFEFQDGRIAPGYRSPLDTALAETDADLLWLILMPPADGAGADYYRQEFVYLISVVLRGLRESSQSTRLDDLWPILESASALAEFARQDGLTEAVREQIQGLVDRYRDPDGTFDETKFKETLGAASFRLRTLHLQLQAHPSEPSSEDPSGDTSFGMTDALRPGSVTYLGFPEFDRSRGREPMLKVVLADLHRAIVSRLRSPGRPESEVLVVMDGVPTQNRAVLRLIRDLPELSRAAGVGLVLVFDGPETPDEGLNQLLLTLYTKMLFHGGQGMAGKSSGGTLALSPDQVRSLKPGQAFLLDPLRQVLFELDTTGYTGIR